MKHTQEPWEPESLDDFLADYARTYPDASAYVAELARLRRVEGAAREALDWCEQDASAEEYPACPKDMFDARVAALRSALEG